MKRAQSCGLPIQLDLTAYLSQKRLMNVVIRSVFCKVSLHMLLVNIFGIGGFAATIWQNQRYSPLQLLHQSFIFSCCNVDSSPTLTLDKISLNVTTSTAHFSAITDSELHGYGLEVMLAHNQRVTRSRFLNKNQIWLDAIFTTLFSLPNGASATSRFHCL